MDVYVPVYVVTSYDFRVKPCDKLSCETRPELVGFNWMIFDCYPFRPGLLGDQFRVGAYPRDRNFSSPIQGVRWVL
jgi:hypothetical protein